MRSMSTFWLFKIDSINLHFITNKRALSSYHISQKVNCEKNKNISKFLNLKLIKNKNIQKQLN